jgi:hypothetical protein
MKKVMSTMILAVLLTLSLATAASAVAPGPQRNAQIDTAATGIQYAGQIGLGGQDIRTTVASIIRVAMGLLGIVAVVIILIGGFTWMTAGGNDDKVAEAKKWIFAGIIGLAIILSAYALSSFVIARLIEATVTPNVAGDVNAIPVPQ